MDEYNFELVVNTIVNMQRIRSFLERTTGELFPLYYQVDLPKDYKVSEGHTLEDLSPHSTRVPGRDSLKENLIILIADIESAFQVLEPMERLEVVMTLDESYNKNKDLVVPDHIRNHIERMCAYLNGE